MSHPSDTSNNCISNKIVNHMDDTLNKDNSTTICNSVLNNSHYKRQYTQPIKRVSTPLVSKAVISSTASRSSHGMSTARHSPTPTSESVSTHSSLSSSLHESTAPSKVLTCPRRKSADSIDSTTATSSTEPASFRPDTIQIPVSNPSATCQQQSPCHAQNSFISSLSLVRKKTVPVTVSNASLVVSGSQHTASGLSQKRNLTLASIDTIDVKVSRQAFDMSLNSPLYSPASPRLSQLQSQLAVQPKTLDADMASTARDEGDESQQTIFSPLYHSVHATGHRIGHTPPPHETTTLHKPTHIIPISAYDAANNSAAAIYTTADTAVPTTEAGISQESEDVEAEEGEFDPTSPLDHCDITFPVEFNNITYTVSGRLRPHYKTFLERCSEIFEVVVFTASQKIYADRLLNIIDPTHKYIKYRLFRDSCLFICGNYLKDLNILGRDLARTIIVDNSPQAFAYQICNGVPISSWYEDHRDQELLHVMEFLESIKAVDDVRPWIQRVFSLEERILASHGSRSTTADYLELKVKCFTLSPFRTFEE
ncbi:hypothetical protein BDEG_27293 [Batrachochytrium dendrobatidis JEL423]|uniref:FCP1 homology domain-containing protein n=1 Tax=Batrachochytrium dendrobatidis (strain JEL423) TaxID=403673 RepID=A0A177WVA6_BATDL|nr:hypothetical protein BDEG_27293 [Batrachochytrium dendrobatidis JEL423]